MKKFKLRKLIQKYFQFISFLLLVLVIALLISYDSFHKKNQTNLFEKTLENIYLKNTVNSIIKNLKPRFETIDYKIQKEHAVDFIIQECLNSREKIILCPTGPLTNIAKAILKKPQICENIEIMTKSIESTLLPNCILLKNVTFSNNPETF